MAIDPNIALGFRPIEIANPLAQYGQVAQIQAAQNQNQVSQMQLDQMRRDDDTMKQIQAKSVEHGGPADINVIANAYINSGNPKFVEFGVNLRQKLDDRAQFANIMGMGGGAPELAPAVSSNIVNEPNAAPGVQVFKVPINNLAAPTAAPSVNALATPPAGSDVAMLRRKRDMFLSMGTAQGNAAARTMDAEIALASKEPVYHNVPGVGLVDPRTGRVVMPSVEKPFAPPTSAAEYALAQKDPKFMQFLRDRAEAMRAPIQPVQPSAPVAVVDPVTGKQIYVSREDALRGRMTPAAAMESLNPKEIQKREALLPQATQSLKTVNNTMSIIGQTVDKLLANPNGINGITGLIGGVTPALTNAARAAKADLEQLKNLAFVQGLTELRAASKTGAGVGNVSNREGDRFENLKASLDRSQSKEDLESSLRKLKAQSEFTIQTMQEAFDSTYSYKSGGGAAAPASSTGIDASNPLLK